MACCVPLPRQLAVLVRYAQPAKSFARVLDVDAHGGQDGQDSQELVVLLRQVSHYEPASDEVVQKAHRGTTVGDQSPPGVLLFIAVRWLGNVPDARWPKVVADAGGVQVARYTELGERVD